MWNKIAIITVAMLASSYASANTPTPRNGPTSNIIRSILNTIYEGQHRNADHTMSELAMTYKDFLSDFVYEPYCDDSRRRGLESACKLFQEKEFENLNDHRWSATYRFNKAEFGPRFTSYNFVRSLPLVDNFLCKITLQVSFDLKTKNLINREYWAACD